MKQYSREIVSPESIILHANPPGTGTVVFMPIDRYAVRRGSPLFIAEGAHLLIPPRARVCVRTCVLVIAPYGRGLHAHPRCNPYDGNAPLAPQYSSPPPLPLACIQSTDNCAQTIAVNRYSTSSLNSLYLSLSLSLPPSLPAKDEETLLFRHANRGSDES
ncbi:hypothetical protein TcWFU_005156 [Taenia crassiceps]|uniref:Uncharacterized protein n=1 Tax=Taenia crassiceps TaxID=6207 RepID=A0ABR4QQT8_9CEST